MKRPLAFDARSVQDHFPGIARYGYNLLSALAVAAPDREIRVLVPPVSGNSRFDLSAVGAMGNVTLTELRAPLFSTISQLTVPGWLRRIGAALYHSPYYLMPYLTPCPALVTIHDLIPLLFPRYFTPFQRLVFAVTVRLAVRTARWVFADSDATARDVRHRLMVPAEKVSIVYAAADPAFSPASDEARSAIRARYALPDMYVLYVGSNKPHKNLVRLIRAYSRVPMRGKVPLVVAGHWDPSHGEARHCAASLGIEDSVRWLGPVAQADLPALYSTASVFVFPSEYEGFGLPVLEAMACGTPTICSTSSSLPEVAGNAAIQLDPRHVESWTSAISHLLLERVRREELSAAGIRRAALFSWESSARQVLSVYRIVEG